MKGELNVGNVAIFKGKLVKFLAKAGILVPARGDIDRSGTPTAGEMAFNTTANKLEVYDGTAWTQLGGGGGAGLVHPTTGSTFELNANNPSMTGTDNTAIGVNSGKFITSGSRNVSVGQESLRNCNTGEANTTLGNTAGRSITSGSNNTIIGSGSGYSLTNQFSNTFVGDSSGPGISGSYNTALGANSFRYSSQAEYSTAVGYQSLARLSTSGSGYYNIGIGYDSGWRLIGGQYNTFIASTGGTSDIVADGCVAIGTDGFGTSSQLNNGDYNAFVLGTVNHRYRLPGRVGTVVQIGPNGTSTGQTGTVRLFELEINGTNSISVRAPDSIASDVTLTLPATAGSANQVLTTDGTGTLSWATPSATITGPIYSRSANGRATKLYGKTASDAQTTLAISTWNCPTKWPLTITASSVCWSPELGIFVSVGFSGTNIRAATSTDGVTWIPRTTPESNTFNSVCWSPSLGLFCAVASSGTNRVMISPDGINWIAAAASAATSWRGVCWSPELALFVAVSNSTSVMYSSDGINWTAGTGMSTGLYSAVCWSPELGIFVAIGQGSVATSVSGTFWTETTLPANTIVAISRGGVVWSAELGLFVAVSDNGSTGLIATSTNGTTWTARTSPASVAWASVEWSRELGVFCAVSTTGTGNRIATSLDGITWTTRINSVNNQWASICWSPELGIFCAVSSTGSTNTGAMVSRDIGLYKERKVVPKYFYRAAQSSEAVKTLRFLTQRTSSTMNANGWASICWSAELGIYVAVGDGVNGTYVATSPNGLDWTARTPSISAVSFTSVCWSAELNLFVAVALYSNVNAIMTSPDGITWTTRSQSTATPLLSVTWSPDLTLFVAVGNNKIITSPNGVTWTDRTSPASRNWKSVVWSPELGLFCAVASNSGFVTTIMTSPNGTTWSARTNIDSNGLNEVMWNSETGMFIATTNNSSSNHFSMSYDGVNWFGVSVPGLTAYPVDGAVIWSPELGIFVATVYASLYISLDGFNWILFNSAAFSTGFSFNWNVKVWNPDLGIFLFSTTQGAANPIFTSKKANLLSEILNLRTSRLY